MCGTSDRGSSTAANVEQLEERLLGARIVSVKPHRNYEGGVVIEFEHRGTNDNSGWLLAHQDNVKFGDDLA